MAVAAFLAIQSMLRKDEAIAAVSSAVRRHLLPHVLRDLHQAAVQPAHGAEVGELGAR